MNPRKNLPPISHPPETVLNIEQLAEWLQVGVKQVERLDIPCVFLGRRSKRWLARDVLEYLAKRRVA